MNNTQAEVGQKSWVQPKKICFVITKGNWGGAQNYVYTLATSLPKNAYEPVVICGEGEGLPKKLKEAGIRTIRLQNLKRDISIIAEIKSFWRLLRIIWKEHPDILHLNSPKAGGLGALAGRIALVPHIIFTAHGWTFNEERKPWQTILITFFSWLTIELCHKVIVLGSRELNQALAMPFVSKKKIALIPNGISNINFLTRENARQKLEISNDAFVVGSIGELTGNKNYEKLIDAVNRVEKKDLTLAILGDGELREKITKKIEKEFTGKHIPLGFRENAAQYLKAFDIFVLPSKKEGLPYVLLEAGLAGLPVIASRVGNIPDIIENNLNGILITPNNTGEIARAIEYFISNPEKQNEFGKKLQEKIEKEFSLEQMVEKTEKLYRN